MKRLFVVFAVAAALAGCATLTNDPETPIALVFSNGEKGSCKLTNKRGAWIVSVPSKSMVRRSSDLLRYDCETESGKIGFGTIKSGIEAEKTAVSTVGFFYGGFVDFANDTYRTYPESVIIQVK